MMMAYASMDRRAYEHRSKAGQSGITVAELMVSIALGMIIVLATTALLLSTKSAYLEQNEEEVIEETGRYALEIISRAVHHAAYEHLDSTEAPVVTTAGMSASIAGIYNYNYNYKSGAAMPGLEAVFSGSEPINGTDVLAVRFFGTGSLHDGRMLDCAGSVVPLPATQGDVETENGWSIFYVSTGTDVKIPALYCKSYNIGSKGKSAWPAQAIAQGVESFQVLYGIDTDADGLPNQYLNAAEIDELDNSLVLDRTTTAATAIDKNRKTYWKKIVSAKVALLVRGSEGSRRPLPGISHDLFGEEDFTASANDGMGGGIGLSQDRGRFEKIFTTTISLRNHAAGSGI